MTQNSLHQYHGVSREAFERMKRELRSLGVSVPEGDECVLSHRGVTGEMSYSEPSRSVEVRITRRPFFVSESTVSSLLDRAMRRYTSAADAPDDEG